MDGTSLNPQFPSGEAPALPLSGWPLLLRGWQLLMPGQPLLPPENPEMRLAASHVAAVNLTHSQYLAMQASKGKMDKGKRPLLDEQVTPEPINFLEKFDNNNNVVVEEKTTADCIVTKKMKYMYFDALEDENELMKEMPFVTTMGDGPFGKKMEGFLFNFGEDQVAIMCFCHGSFLSPAEFIKHAGGTDTSNPMEHITISEFKV